VIAPLAGRSHNSLFVSRRREARTEEATNLIDGPTKW
jgi:hypothetical protein